MKAVCFIFAISLLLSGCTGTGGGLGSIEKTNQLYPGMTTTQVTSLLGAPASAQRGSEKLVWKYSLHEYWKGFVPYYLVFDQRSGKLERWFANEAEYLQQQQLWIRALPPTPSTQKEKEPSDTTDDCSSKYKYYEDRMCYCHGMC